MRWADPKGAPDQSPETPDMQHKLSVYQQCFKLVYIYSALIKPNNTKTCVVAVSSVDIIRQTAESIPIQTGSYLERSTSGYTATSQKSGLGSNVGDRR